MLSRSQLRGGDCCSRLIVLALHVLLLSFECSIALLSVYSPLVLRIKLGFAFSSLCGS